MVSLFGKDKSFEKSANKQKSCRTLSYALDLRRKVTCLRQRPLLTSLETCARWYAKIVGEFSCTTNKFKRN